MLISETPQEIDDEVNDFCKHLSSSKPIYLDIHKEPYALFDECYQNVENKIVHDGGDIVYGWKIWLAPKCFIEGEFHAIWQSENGELRDITPNSTGEDLILFVPDPIKKYTGKRVNNVRKNLSSNRLVDDYIAINDAFFYFTNHGDNSTQPVQHFSGWEVELYKWLTGWKNDIQELISLKKGPGSACPCGSGLKYKKCHAKEVRKNSEIVIKKFAKFDG